MNIKPNMNKELKKEACEHIQSKPKPNKKIKFIDVHFTNDTTFELNKIKLLPLERQKACSKTEFHRITNI